MLRTFLISEVNDTDLGYIYIILCAFADLHEKRKSGMTTISGFVVCFF